MKIRRSLPFYRKLAAKLVQKSLGQAIGDRTQRPVPVEDLCRLVGIEEVTRAPMQVEGFLLSGPGGLAIRVNSDRSTTRQRFTIAHELGHVLLAAYEQKPIQVKCRSRHFSDDEEALVNMIAAEILMPSRELIEFVRSLPSGWEAIEHIVWGYRVSYTTAIRRLLSLDGILGVWITGNQTNPCSLSAWGTDTVRRIVNGDEVWAKFCRNPSDGTTGLVGVLVESSSRHFKAERLKCEVKYMRRMGARTNSQAVADNCWILGWTETRRSFVQLTFDFGSMF